MGYAGLILLWAIAGPSIAIGMHWHPVVGVIAFLAIILSLRERGGLGCLIFVVWVVAAVIAMLALGNLVALTSVVAWCLILLAMAST